MKKIRRTLREKGSFKILVIFPRLRDKALISDPILLKLAQIDCISVKINHIENNFKNPSNIMEIGPF